jgi:putative glutathione S-transferase
MSLKAQFPNEQSESGEFERQEDAFREWVTADDSRTYRAEAGRYHLYISLACPWASRTLIVRNLKGLQDALASPWLTRCATSAAGPFRDGPATAPIR